MKVKEYPALPTIHSQRQTLSQLTSFQLTGVFMHLGKRAL